MIVAFRCLIQQMVACVLWNDCFYLNFRTLSQEDLGSEIQHVPLEIYLLPAHMNSLTLQPQTMSASTAPLTLTLTLAAINLLSTTFPGSLLVIT
jgi:hypothetical protein